MRIVHLASLEDSKEKAAVTMLNRLIAVPQGSIITDIVFSEEKDPITLDIKYGYIAKVEIKPLQGDFRNINGFLEIFDGKVWLDSREEHIYNVQVK